VGKVGDSAKSEEATKAAFSLEVRARKCGL